MFIALASFSNTLLLIGFTLIASVAMAEAPEPSQPLQFPNPRHINGALFFKNNTHVASVYATSESIVRIRVAKGQSFGRDHSYAVTASSAANLKSDISLGPKETKLKTRAMTVQVSHDPFGVQFIDSSGKILDFDVPTQPISWQGSRWRVFKTLADNAHVYGLGEKGPPLDKRGKKLGGVSYAMWNSDTFGYGTETDPLYATFPFFMVMQDGLTYGVLVDNTYRTSFDVGKTTPGVLSFGSEGGELNYYIIAGPSPKHVLRHYADLTGHMPMPPLWALGYHQCRYSYYPDSKLRELAKEFRTRHIPVDALWLDIHYQDGYAPFTWDAKRFPNPKQLISDLAKDHMRLVTIVDPHLKKSPGSRIYGEGIQGNHFVTRPNGSVFEGPVWPSKAEKNPGPSVFPDFTRAETRTWWGKQYKALLDLGVAGIWNDMNEPAVFIEPHGTMPLDLRHDNEGAPTDHKAMHNVYGMLMSRATFEGLQELQPDVRPFVLTRSSFAGGQRYAALWPGDNVSDWSHLRASLPMLMNLGLSGMPFVGADIGGFVQSASAELYARWLQVGVFYPFMRSHTDFGTKDQEPWRYGATFERINRQSIELRYQLLPYIYQVMHEAHATGVPALRPLFMEFPKDASTYAMEDQFMLGADLMVAPALWEGMTEREVYLPEGKWVDFTTGRVFHGNSHIRVRAAMDTIPMFVREGAVVPTQATIQSTEDMPTAQRILNIFPASDSTRTLYEDDGKSLGYLRGETRERTMTVTQEDNTLTITLSKVHGTYAPSKPRLLIIRVLTEKKIQIKSSTGLDAKQIKSMTGKSAQAFQSWSLPDLDTETTLLFTGY